MLKPLNLHDDAYGPIEMWYTDVKKDNRDYRCSAKFNLQFILVYLFAVFWQFRQGKFTVQLFLSFFSVCAKSIHLNRNPLDQEFHMMMIDFPTQISQLLQAVWFESDSECEHIDRRQWMIFVCEIPLMWPHL